MRGRGLDVGGVTGEVGENEGSLHCTKGEREGERERERERERMGEGEKQRVRL